MISTGNRSSLFRASCNLLTKTEMGRVTGLPDASDDDVIVVVVAPVVVLVVVEVVVGADETSGMDGLVRAAMPGKPMKVRMKFRARSKVPFCSSFVFLSSSSSNPDLVRYASRFSDKLLRKNSNVETPSGVVSILAISDKRLASAIRM